MSAADARRVACLLPGLTPERAARLTTDSNGRCWMPAEILAALAVRLPASGKAHARSCPVSAADARRVACLLPGLTPERAARLTTDSNGRCWMPAEILAALAVRLPASGKAHARSCPVSAADARRVACLLPGLTPERAARLTTDSNGRCWMPAEILAALAVTS